MALQPAANGSTASGTPPEGAPGPRAAVTLARQTREAGIAWQAGGTAAGADRPRRSDHAGLFYHMEALTSASVVIAGEA